MTISAGNVDIGGMTRSVSSAEILYVDEIGNLIVAKGAILKLKEVAEVKMGHKDRESFSRLNSRNVVSLNVIKRTGENPIEASDEFIRNERRNEFPTNLEV
jgi:multidrug efflux pump subunit AcrB